MGAQIRKMVSEEETVGFFLGRGSFGTFLSPWREKYTYAAKIKKQPKPTKRDVLIGEITQHTLLRTIELNRRKQIDTPTDFSMSVGVRLCSINWNLTFCYLIMILIVCE